MKQKYLDYVGKQHGRLKILSITKNEYKQSVFNCLCDCGNSKSFSVGNITRTKSCGCYRKEFSRKNHTTHGQSGNNKNRSKAYAVWTNMKSRCSNPKSTMYKHYGGRGILVCERWEKFENFYEDMGDVNPGMTLERIDVNGNYEPSNCKWTSFLEQASNRRSNRYLIVNGEKIHMTEASRRYNIKVGTIWNRLINLKWDDEKAVLTPVKYSKRQEMKNL